MTGWLVLVNPSAGRRPPDVSRIRAALAGAGVETDIEAPGSRTEMVATLEAAISSGRSRFAVVGGDGTLGLAVDTLLRREWAEPPVLAPLPGGSGSDFTRTFGLPRGLEEAALRLVDEQTYLVDVGVIEGGFGSRFFLNAAQAGVGAAAAFTAQHLTRRLGGLRYSIAFASRLPGFSRVEIDLEAGKRAHRGMALAVVLANGQFFAGGWNIAPKAMLVDGELDVQVFQCRKREAPRLVPRIIKGVHLGDPAVRRWSAPSFRLDTEVPWPVEADGEYLGQTPVTGHVIPCAVRIKI